MLVCCHVFRVCVRHTAADTPHGGTRPQLAADWSEVLNHDQSLEVWWGRCDSTPWTGLHAWRSTCRWPTDARAVPGKCYLRFQKWNSFPLLLTVALSFPEHLNHGAGPALPPGFQIPLDSFSQLSGAVCKGISSDAAVSQDLTSSVLAA